MILSIREAAEDDILRQVERYAAQRLPKIAHRFHDAILAAFDALDTMPEAGPPHPAANTALVGLRRWPVKGFDEYWIYYLVQSDTLDIVRVLHSKRDVERILSRTG